MRFEGGWGAGRGLGGAGGQGGHQRGVPGGLESAGIKQQARKLEIVKSVDLNSKNEQIALTERGVTFH